MGAPITSTSGGITVSGNGGTGPDAGDNEGVRVADAGRITTTSGAVSITGHAGSGSADAGVELLTLVSGSPVVASVSGDVQIVGGSYYNTPTPGVLIEDGTTIDTTGAGTVTIYSFSEVGSGVVIQGSGTKVTSAKGALTIEGTSQQGDGVNVIGGGSVTSTGTGATAAPIAINGTSNGSGVGVLVQAGGKVTSIDGPIAVNGSGSSGDAVQVNATGTVQATGGGNIQVNSSRSEITVDGGTVAASSGFVALTAGGDVQLIGGGKVSSAKNAASVKAGGNVMIDATSSLSAPASGFTFTITGGSANHGGTVTVLGTLQGGSQGQILGGNGKDTFVLTPASAPGFLVEGGVGQRYDHGGAGHGERPGQRPGGRRRRDRQPDDRRHLGQRRVHRLEPGDDC